jgi:hypothetical protein
MVTRSAVASQALTRKAQAGLQATLNAQHVGLGTPLS